MSDDASGLSIDELLKNAREHDDEFAPLITAALRKLSLGDLLKYARRYTDELFPDPAPEGFLLGTSIRRQLEFLQEKFEGGLLLNESEQNRLILGHLVAREREADYPELAHLLTHISYRTRNMDDWRKYEPAERARRAAMVEPIVGMPELQGLSHISLDRKEVPTDELFRRARAVNDRLVELNPGEPLFRVVRDQLDFLAKIPRRRWFHKRPTVGEVAQRPNLGRISRNDFVDIVPRFADILCELHSRWLDDRL